MKTDEIAVKRMYIVYPKNSRMKKAEPSCNLDDLKKNSEDLVLLTGNYKNFFGQLFYKNKLKDFEQILNSLKNSFKDRLYIEIQRHNEHQEKNFENYLLNISKSLTAETINVKNCNINSREKKSLHEHCLFFKSKTFYT